MAPALLLSLPTLLASGSASIFSFRSRLMVAASRMVRPGGACRQEGLRCLISDSVESGRTTGDRIGAAALQPAALRLLWCTLQRLVAVWQRQGTMAVQQHQGSTPTHQASRFNILMRLAYLELAVHRHSLAGMEGAQEARLGLRVVLCRQLL